MNIILVQEAARIAEASSLAHENHTRLREKYPWLPEKKLEDFVQRIAWMVREGRVYALEDGDQACAFLGWFRIDDFRNLGPGALTPDWCFGAAGDTHEVSRLMSPLVRRLMNDLKAEGIPIHAIGIPSTSEALLEEFSMLSYGRIVLDAARPADEILALPCAEPDGFIVRPAEAADARNLAGPDALTFVAECDGELAGFIKADPPNFDVSWFVHGESTLAICGLYVDPAIRGRGVGENLLRALVSAGERSGYSLISVDCETHNPEARAFWTARFKPVTWSFERRF